MAPSVPDVYISNKGIDKEVGNKLNRIITLYLLDCELPESLLTWAKENIPNMNTPNIIFIPMVEWLKNKYSIEFKDKKC